MHCQTIYKYPLNLSGLQTISIPEGGRILHVGMQYGKITLWAMVDSNNPLSLKEIWIFGTGEEIPAQERELKYIGTVKDDEDQHSAIEYIWHVFEIPAAL